MKSQLIVPAKTILLVSALLALCGAHAAQRPLTDFLSRQGAYCIILNPDGSYNCAAGSYPVGGPDGGCFQYIPGFPNFLDWTDPVGQDSVSFDYAGLINAQMGNPFGTSVSGSITELPQADGTVVESVTLHAVNALTWATTGFGANGTDLFGHAPAEVAGGAQASLGSCTLRVVLHGPAPGAPLPDLIELLGGCGPWSFMTVHFIGQSSGALPDGTPAQLQVTETGLLSVAGLANPKSRVALDGFPAEHISIQPTRK